MKKLLLTTILAFFTFSLIAQTKVAYIYEDYVFENYKGLEKLNEEIEKKQTVFQEEFNKIALEYQNANLEYQNALKDISKETSESINDKVKNVQDLRAAAENYQVESERLLQQFIDEEVEKIRLKIKTTAEKIAADKKIDYVLSHNQSSTLMFQNGIIISANKAQNISDDILKILNAEK